MKEKYNRFKKNTSVTLSIAVTTISIGVFGIIAKQYVLGGSFIACGIFATIIMFKNRIQTLNFEKNAKNLCPSCTRATIIEKEMRYYIAGAFSSEEDFYKCELHNDRKIMDITYYKCLDCRFCLTEITFFQVRRGNIKKISSHKINLNFDYDSKNY